ncbi:alpha/beta hydrolase [Myxacorys almedinensis]|uniref:Alpha/beta hydrolase n=1 Tax=Myxacorys almedinensis A TaxID=2690445 RepID=A0A8J7Z701_9CYAN|nr:alpha/beta hydrolase [Myxacorys almedinensis]NDJ19208.1 alpha/beta hydrolase [Myxacorys almedinensis A]
MSVSLARQISIGLGAAIIFASSPAFSAEQVVLKYRVLRESVSVSELTTFANTGQASPDLQTYFRLSRQNPEAVRQTLTRQVSVNPVLLDRVLNSPLGNGILDQLGQAIQTPRGGAERQALRAALTLSASDDGKVSILEILQKYPTQEVVVDGDRVEGTYRQLNQLAERLRNPLGNILSRIFR